MVVILLQLIKGYLPWIPRGDARVDRHTFGGTVIIKIRLRYRHRDNMEITTGIPVSLWLLVQPYFSYFLMLFSFAYSLVKFCPGPNESEVKK